MASRSPRFIRVLVSVMTAAAILGLPLQVAGHGGGGGGPAPAFTVTALTETVSVGQSAAFEVFLRSDGSDAFDYIRLEGSAPGATLTSAPAGCTGSGASVTCKLGSLASGSTRTLLFVFDAPATAGSIEFTARLKVAYWHYGVKKYRDAFVDSAVVSVINDPDVFTTWQPAHDEPVAFSTGVGNNAQTTMLNVPPVDFGYQVRLAEIDDSIVCGTKVYKGFGEAIEMSVANGAELDPHLTVTLTYGKSVSWWKVPWLVKFVHQTDDGVCHFPPRGCNAHNDGFCFDAFWSGSGWHKNLVIRVELPTNGRGRGL